MDTLYIYKTGTLYFQLKILVRTSSWPENDPIREQMWLRLCQNLTKEEFTDLFYWDTVQQIYGSKGKEYIACVNKGLA